MDDFPTGTVTLLFTDIEGSTRLLDLLGDRYGKSLAAHCRLDLASHPRKAMTCGNCHFGVRGHRAR